MQMMSCAHSKVNALIECLTAIQENLVGRAFMYSTHKITAVHYIK